MDTQNRFPFAKKRLESLPTPAAGRTVYHDTATPGLILRVTTNGVKSFHLYRKFNGSPIRMHLGDFPEMSVENARKACQTESGKLAQGIDPRAERRAVRHEQTLKGLFEFWLETHAKQHKRTWKEDERQYNVFLKPWANRKLSAVKKADVAALHAKIGKTYDVSVEGKTETRGGPYAANRLLALLRAMFNKAPDMGFTGPNPTAGIRKFKETKRDRFLEGEELPAFFRALLTEPNETLRDFFLLALLTGARRANVQAMAWADVNLDAGFWRIPYTKRGEPVVVPLCGPALAILRTRQNARNGSPWVLPSTGATGHIVEPKSAWKRILTRAGLEDVRIHDLRRSLGSWQAMSGASLPIIGKSLGHSQPSTTAIYARLALDPVRTSVETATTAIMQAAGVKLADGAIIDAVSTAAEPAAVATDAAQQATRSA